MSRRSLLALPIAVFAIALIGLLVRGDGGHELRIPKQAAVRAALANPAVHKHLAKLGYDHTRATALDGELARVTFFDGAQIRAVAAVDAHGRVEHTQLFSPGAPWYGSSLSDAPWLLALLALGFVFATATLPLARWRNLDVLALLALTVPILAGDHQLFSLSVLSGYPPLLYLCARFVWRAKHGEGEQAGTPLWEDATRSVPRLLGYLTAAAALLLAVVAISSPGAIDVGFASTAGATLLLHGTLPYGHMPPDVVHGDTYPLLGYVLYLPAAAIAPVRDAFDDTSSAVLVAFAAALVVAAALRKSGRRAMLAWLCFPPLAVAVASGTNDLLLAAAVALALALAARSARSALILAAGAWIKLAPVALVPLWLARTRGKPLMRAITAMAALTAALMATLLIMGGTAGVGHMLDAMTFQLDRGTLQSAWALLDTSWAQHVAQAATLALIAWSALRAREFATDPARLAALCGAVLAALQLSATNWSYLYVVWLFPCAAFALLGDRAEKRTATTAG
jgi:Glycosyltransferase family 87